MCSLCHTELAMQAQGIQWIHRTHQRQGTQQTHRPPMQTQGTQWIHRTHQTQRKEHMQEIQGTQLKNALYNTQN